MGSRFAVPRLLAATIVVLGLVAAACGGGEAETTTAPSPATTAAPAPVATEPPAPPATEPPEPKSVTVGMGNLPPSGVPWTGTGSPGQYVWAQVFDALTFIAPDGSVQPALATSWESVDETTWRFTIRDGVTFQNGEALDAAAVEATFAVLLSEDGRSTFSANVNNYRHIDSVTAVDDMTVEIKTSRPDVLIPNVLSIAYIVPPAYYAEVGAEGFATAPVGSGPFASVEWTDQNVLLEAWDGSWRGVPTIEILEFLNLNDPAARTQALQSGQIDIAQSISPDQIAPLSDAGFTIFSGSRGSVQSLALIGNRGGPLEKQEVRQALNLAVDTKAIVDALLQGVAAQGVWAIEGVNGYDPGRDPYGYDPDAARQLLADAGFADGFDMVAEITVGAFPADADIYEAMKGFLADVGVNVELRQIDFVGEWLPKFLGRDDADWDGDAFGLSWNAAPLMDAIRPFNFYSCGWLNEFFCDQAAEDLITQINGTFDEAERDALLAQLLDLTKENPPAIWLVEVVELWAHSSDVTEFAVNNFNIRFENVDIGA
jgi:peptide/nickel transport system substrate-binding protein